MMSEDCTFCDANLSYGYLYATVRGHEPADIPVCTECYTSAEEVIV